MIQEGDGRIKGEVHLFRRDGRWEMVVFATSWIEDDIRRELKRTKSFIVDPKSSRTNGISFVQQEER